MKHSSKGFTLVELVISIAIFGIMTSLLVAKYGNFNQSVLMTDTAYDVAMIIRLAQTYGISVSGQSGAADRLYGVHFETGTSKNQQVVLFNGPQTGTGVYTSSDVNTYALKRGAIVSKVCAGSVSISSQNVASYSWDSNCSNGGSNTLDISFIRPNPEAIICYGGSCSNSDTAAQIELQATDGSTRTVIVLANGQISVGD